MLRQSVDKIKDRPRGLTVETGGRFVEEEEQLGLSSELDTDGETLSLFHIET
jgi:hypothetical protein